MEARADAPQPLASIIKIGADGAPFLEGFQCGSCREVLLEYRRGCPKCGAVASLVPKRLADHGKLHSYSIVHRSFPGVSTPFISAVVELDGGGFLKGNLLGVAPKPEAIRFDMPVRIEFDRRPCADADRDVLRYVFMAPTT